ncbi:MAG TPA: glycogen synthase GlgA [Candidatus Faecivivens stercoravium]|uniref:Glycogen synthase n=1 Tax=Candidatus Faecivivens stercoravium TaxID=2840803 RepID=A0A9D1DYY7_9FIRM|nr:glycogen synthase GlgA [Candidatus Faecivivens stercoravium]
MKILFAAAEASPFIKVGGLGDVAGALPKALVEKGHDVRVVLPLYSSIKWEMREKCQYIKYFYFMHGWRNCYCGIFEANIDGVIYYLVDNEYYFKRRAPYGEFDDGERFAFFSRAVLEILPQVDFFPDIIHCNDWHTAAVPVYLDAQYRWRDGYEYIRTVFSIHNIEFQGKYGLDTLGSVFALPPDWESVVEHDGCLNLMKGAIERANAVNTVSETYANEILDPYFSFGLDTILRPRRYKLSGIVNGIDVKAFDPATDPAIAVNYDIDTRADKVENKLALQKELGLAVDPDIPMIGMVGRLTSQKGIDLMYPIMEELMKHEVQLVVLGTGYAEIEDFMRFCDAAYHDKMRAMITFSSSMAQKIYSGADLFLMPSKSEPCGLAQLISMRYGTIPVVHAVGGLKDTVVPYNPAEGTGNGVNFQSYNAWDMYDAIMRGIAIWSDPEERDQIMLNGMSGDYSWDVSADKYLKLYESVL